MKANIQYITLFEHQRLKLNQRIRDVVVDESLINSLERFYGNGLPYYELIHKGVQFKNYVGVIQIGNTLIEVLPKADKTKNNNNDVNEWRNILIDMLRSVHGFEVKAPSSSNLNVRKNSVLDLYFELFLTETEYLLRKGLVKKYRKTKNNITALKGRMLFSKQISKNLVHKERFFSEYTTYDTEHILHIIIYQTLLILKRINTNSALTSRICSLLLNFPEMPIIKINQASFDRIELNRKTNDYRKAIEIARLILLHYHPDLSNGRNDVLALMFDMNLLWEQFVIVSLRKNKALNVKGQSKKYFWKPDGGRKRTIRPDITISHDEKNYIIDTKWKLVERKPSMDDVRQMYAYHQYFNAEKVALLYPGKADYISGKFVDEIKQKKLTEMECGLMFTKHNASVRQWQNEINQQVFKWIKN